LENLLAYILLLAPGLVVMLINERAGSHPASKYTNTEKIVMAVLFSVPVFILNLVLLGFKNRNIGEASATGLLIEIQSLGNLLFYSITSILFSFLVCLCWHTFVKRELVVDFINKLRKTGDKAEVNEGNLVWEDAFHGAERQAVRVTIKDARFYGSPVNMSEIISDERCLLLDDSEIIRDIVERYNIPVKKVYVDTKSGVAVEIFDSNKFVEAYYRGRYIKY